MSPEPANEIYQVTVNGLLIKVILDETAEIAVGDQGVKGLMYSVFNLTGANKIIFIPGFCFLEIKGNDAKVFIDSGAVLKK